MVSLSMGSLERRIIPPAPGRPGTALPPVYSAAVVSRSLALLLACSPRRRLRRKARGRRGRRSSPSLAAWKTLLGDFVTAPLAADGRRVYVATRDGAVRALDQATGAVAWKAEGFPGRLSAADGVLLVRGEDGTLWSLQPRTGAVRWKTETGVAGTLPAVIDGDRALVAGRGLAAVELASGRVLWTDGLGCRDDGPSRWPPAPASSAGEADGTLRCRDRATGSTAVDAPHLRGPPRPSARRRGAAAASTSARATSGSSRSRSTRASSGWAWRVGADIGHPGLLLPEHVLFASYDAVLYALRRGGNLAWRGALPSRPLSAPQLVGEPRARGLPRERDRRLRLGHGRAGRQPPHLGRDPHAADPRRRLRGRRAARPVRDRLRAAGTAPPPSAAGARRLPPLRPAARLPARP